MPTVRLGPDSARYLLAGSGERVAKPFHLRVLLPWVCGESHRRWNVVWWLSWPLAAAGMLWWGADAGWWAAGASAVLLLSLAGVFGPHVVRPVGVDLPSMAVSIVAVAAFHHGWWPLAVALILVAAAIKESAPVWAALWAWHPLLLAGLVVPLIIGLWRRPELDQVTSQGVLREVHDHPIRTAFEHHAGRWRDPRMVLQWGGCLAALHAAPPRVWATLAVAHLQLVVATDTYRLLHTAAGPLVALTAAQNVPTEWLPYLCAVSLVWWIRPEFQ